MSDEPETPRVDATEVAGEGFKTKLSTDEVQSRIDDANLEVSEKLADKGMSDRRLKKIEKYLARHLIKFDAERQVDHKQLGNAQKRYSGAFDGESLKATAPGQTALDLDTSNTLGPDGDDFWAVTV